MTRIETRWNAAVKGIAGVALAALFTVAAPLAVKAHPFAFDATQMPGFTVLTAEDGAVKATDVVVIEYDGPIAHPMAANLRTIWDSVRASRRFGRVLLRLNSPGGSDVHGQQVIEVLTEIRKHAALSTVVGEGGVCASMCVAIYIQGETRYASPASSWMFHGACRRMSNVPSLSLTTSHFALFRQREIDDGFINYLFEKEYVTRPGAYWISGIELFERSNIITEILPNWRPVDPNPGPAHVIRGGI